MFKIQNNDSFRYFHFENYIVTIVNSRSLCFVNNFLDITVNEDFLDLDYDTQRFILYHELGHIHHEHMFRSDFNHKMYRLKRKLFQPFGLVVKEEIQADFFAVKKMGKTEAIKAITETMKLFNSTRELMTRRLLIKLFCK